MITITWVIVAAALALGLSMRTRIPASVLAIVAGIGLRLSPTSLNLDLARDGLLLAATFLVFTVGAEIDRRPLQPHRRAALGMTALAFVVTAAGGGVLYLTMDLDRWSVVYLVVALASGSTLLVFDVLRQRERFFEPIGRLVTATTLAQDVIVLIALSVLAAVAAMEHGGPHAGGEALLGLAGLALGAWATARWLAPWAMTRAGFDEEERLLFVLLILFAFAGAARWTGNPLVVGAYFAGLGISRFPSGGIARSYLKSFSDFFTMVFYVTLGMLVAAPNVTELIVESALVTALLLARSFVLLPLVRSLRLTVRASIEAVTLLTAAGELAVIVGLVGMELGHVGDHTLGVIAVVVVVTTSVAPWLSSDPMTWRLTRWYPTSRATAIEPRPRDHVLLLGCGETGTTLLQRLAGTSVDVVVVDDDPEVIAALQKRDIRALRGDGASRDTLELAGASDATAIVSTMRRWEDNLRLLSMLKRPRIFVRVFSEPDAERVRELGGIPVTEVEVATQALLEWHAALP